MLLATIGRAAAAEPDTAVVGAANAWLAAVGRNDGRALVGATSFPFTYRTTNKLKQCEGVVTNEAGLKTWLTCVRRSEELLIKELSLGESPVQAAPAEVESRALKGLAKKITVVGTWVRSHINGDGITFSFRFLLEKTAGDQLRVRALLIDVDFDTG